jgi:SAM-dependent methyltransferase
MYLYNNFLKLKPTRWGTWLQRMRASAEWKIIRRSAPTQGSFLEIGPGHGVMAEIVRETGFSYLAVESNGNIARSIYESGFQVCRACVPPLPFCSRSIGIVYAAHVIEHLPDSFTALLFAQEVHRILREDGIFFISAPDVRSFSWHFWDADYTHTFPVSARRLRQMLSDANFEIISEIYFSGPIQGPVSALMSFMAKILPSEPLGISRELGERVTRLRLTFLRNICVLAHKR